MLAAFGDSFVDVVVEVSNEAKGGTYDGRIGTSPGGCANVPIWFSRDGGESEIYGIRGDDPFGEYFEESVEAEGVGCNLGIRDGPTGLCVSLSGGEERTMYTRRGVNDEVEFGDVAPHVDSINRADILFVRGYALRRDPMRSVLLALLDSVDGPEVWFNPGAPNLAGHEHVGRVLEYTDLLIMNRDEAEVLAGGRQEELLTSVGEVVVTGGGDEANAINSSGSVSLRPEPVEVMDVTGAGDAFAAGYAAAYLRGEGTEERLRNGHLLASRAIGRMGAV